MIGKKKMLKQKKNLYEGIFNGQRQVYYLHRKAHSIKQARLLFCGEIAKRQGVEQWLVLQYFPEGKENYIIKEVKDE